MHDTPFVKKFNAYFEEQAKFVENEFSENPKMKKVNAFFEKMSSKVNKMASKLDPSSQADK